MFIRANKLSGVILLAMLFSFLVFEQTTLAAGQQVFVDMQNFSYSNSSGSDAQIQLLNSSQTSSSGSKTVTETYSFPDVLNTAYKNYNKPDGQVSVTVTSSPTSINTTTGTANALNVSATILITQSPEWQINIYNPYFIYTSGNNSVISISPTTSKDTNSPPYPCAMDINGNPIPVTFNDTVDLTALSSGTSDVSVQVSFLLATQKHTPDNANGKSYCADPNTGPVPGQTFWGTVTVAPAQVASFTVSTPTPTCTISSFTAANPNPPYGQTTDLSFILSGGTFDWNIKESNNNAVIPPSGNGSGTISVSTSATSGTQTYTLTCDDGSSSPPSLSTSVVHPPPLDVVCSWSSQSVVTNQSLAINQSAPLYASGGDNSYSWSAPGGTLSSITGSSVNVTYSSAGSYSVIVNSATKSATCTVNVTSNQDFNLGASPGSNNVTPGGSAAYTISSSGINGFNGNIDLSALNLPAGVTANFSPTNIINPTGTSSTTLNVITSTSTPTGSYNITVRGVSGTISHDITVALVVSSVVSNENLSATLQVSTVSSTGPWASRATVTAPLVNQKGPTLWYRWSSTGAVDGSSVASATPASCPGQGMWVATGTNGNTSNIISSNQAGCTYTITYSAKSSLTVPFSTANSAITVIINAPSSTPTPTPYNCPPNMSTCTRSITVNSKNISKNLSLNGIKITSANLLVAQDDRIIMSTPLPIAGKLTPASTTYAQANNASYYVNLATESPVIFNGLSYTFDSWTGCIPPNTFWFDSLLTDRSGKVCTVNWNDNITVTANYKMTPALTVRARVPSNPNLKNFAVSINRITTDVNGKSIGYTDFTRYYNPDSNVSVTADDPSSNLYFQSWSDCDSVSDTYTCNVSLANKDKTVTVNYYTPVLNVSLSAAPSKGASPLNSILTAQVSGGTSKSTYNYYFWWNCSGLSNEVSNTSDGDGDDCGYLNLPDPGTCIETNGFNFSIGYACNSLSTTSVSTINHAYSPGGTYTGKVIVEQTLVPSKAAWATINVGPSLPPSITPPVLGPPPDSCIDSTAATITWNYSGTTPQSAYQIKLSRTGNFNNPDFDSGKVQSGSSSYIASGLSFNTTYQAQVTVWDSNNNVSTPASSNSWKTPIHAYPSVDFSWLPANPTVNQSVQFTDLTQFSDGNGKGQRGWDWLFGDGGFSTLQNPTYTYTAGNLYSVTETVTDKDDFTCSLTQSVNVERPIPVWKEVSPR